MFCGIMASMLIAMPATKIKIFFIVIMVLMILASMKNKFRAANINISIETDNNTAYFYLFLQRFTLFVERSQVISQTFHCFVAVHNYQSVSIVHGPE